MNESTNSLIRGLHSKKSFFSEIGRTELKRISTFLNNRPRKCLDLMTPRKKLTVFLDFARAERGDGRQAAVLYAVSIAFPLLVLYFAHATGIHEDNATCQ